MPDGSPDGLPVGFLGGSLTGALLPTAPPTACPTYYLSAHHSLHSPVACPTPRPMNPLSARSSSAHWFLPLVNGVPGTLSDGLLDDSPVRTRLPAGKHPRPKPAPAPEIRPSSLYTSSNRNLAGLRMGGILSLSFSMVRFHFLSLRRCGGIFVNESNKIMHGRPASRFYLIVYVPRKVR